MRWIPLLLLGVGIVLSSWVALILLARRLPPGLAKDLANFLPACATTLRRLRKDPRVPRLREDRCGDRRRVGDQPDRSDP